MWFIIGLLLGAALLGLAMFLRSRNIGVKWYEWTIGSIGLLMLLFTILNFTGSLTEHENFAAWTFLWLSGLPSVILIGIALFLPWRRHYKASSN